MNNAIDLPSLQSIELGNRSFEVSSTTIIESMILNWNELKWIDLPSLQSIKLGLGVLCGHKDDESCSLTMRSIHSIENLLKLDLPNLSSITSKGHSFCYPRSVIMESIEMKWQWFDNRHSKCWRSEFTIFIYKSQRIINQ